MSTDKKPSDDFTAILLILIVIVYFGLVIPGVRLIRSRYIEPALEAKQKNPHHLE